MKQKNIKFEIWEENDGSLGALIETNTDSIITTGNTVSELIKNINKAIQTIDSFHYNQLNILKALFNSKEVCQ